jgi:hypothetical protein
VAPSADIADLAQRVDFTSSSAWVALKVLRNLDRA